MDIQNGVKLLLEADKIEAINFPTETHREFIVFISQQCKKSAITALLKGSMAKGNAQEYSDIDIILTGENISNCLDLIIGSFDQILLSEHFAATSPYMVVYANGLAVEYDVRKTVTEEDIKKSLALNISDYQISGIPRDRLFVNSCFCPKRSREYSLLMIAQMCCAKLLCQKAALARDIYYDRVKLLGNDMTLLGNLDKATIHEEPKRQFLNRIRQLIFAYDAGSPEISEYLHDLFFKAAEIENSMI